MTSRRRFMSGVMGGSASLLLPGFLGCRGTGAVSGAPRTEPVNAEPKEIVIGAILGLSGDDSILGTETKSGMDIALADVNGGTGYTGPKIRLIYEDTQLDPAQAQQKVRKLIEDDKVVCVIGDAASRPTIAAAEYAEGRGVPLVSPGATSVELTRNRKYVFRVCFSDDKQAIAAAKFARLRLQATRAAILYVTGNRYSELLQSVFAGAFEKMGGQIVAKEAYAYGEPDVSPFLKRIKDAKPQVIFAPVYPSDVAKLGPTKRDLGIDVPLLGTDGWEGPAIFAKGVLETIEGCYFTTLYAPDGVTEGAKAFVERVKQMTGGRPPSEFSACGYDAVRLVVDAISRTKPVSRAGVRDALERTKGFKGASGTFDIDEAHDARKPIPIMTISSGALRYHAMIEM